MLVLLLAAAATSVGQPAGPACLQDEVVLDGNADGQVSVGDVVFAPEDEVGEAGGGHRLLNRVLLPMPGSLKFLDADANGAPTPGDAALWDHASNGRNAGDVLLGNVTAGSRSYAFGHIVRSGDSLPPAGLGTYAGGFGYLDDDGDGRRQPREGAYGSQGGAVAAGDVRLAVDGWERGSLVRATDQDVGQALAAGPALGFVDEDGSGDFTVADCPSPSSSSSSAPASTSASPSPSSASGPTTLTNGPHTSGPQPSPGPSSSAGKGTPAPGWASLLVLLAFAAAARRRQ